MNRLSWEPIVSPVWCQALQFKQKLGICSICLQSFFLPAEATCPQPSNVLRHGLPLVHPRNTHPTYPDLCRGSSGCVGSVPPPAASWSRPSQRVAHGGHGLGCTHWDPAGLLPNTSPVFCLHFTIKDHCKWYFVLLLIRLNRDPCGNFHYHIGSACGNFHYHMGQLQKGAWEGLFMSGLLRD